jgi:phospholipase C
MVRLRLAAIAVSLVWGVAGQLASITTTAADNQGSALSRIDHIVVIYEENHSFDNLYGGWEGVDGLGGAPAARTTQVDQAGSAYACLKQNDVNLTSPPLPADCADPRGFTSNFPNAPFNIDTYIPATATTCPSVLQAFSFHNGVANGNGLPGGCTEDLVHRFYEEQYQLNGGQMNRYVTGSDAIGLTMGVYDTRALPVYRYLHQDGHPHYAIADKFFEAAFGGSFLNHQWLVAAATPTYPGASSTLHSIVDTNGMPRGFALYTPTVVGTRDGPLTVACPSPVEDLACGDYAVNTMQPAFQPSGAFGAKIPAQTNPTIGDRLNGAGVDWAWYSGGWSNANGDVNAPGWTNGDGPACSDPNVDPRIAAYPRCPSNVFQYHHQAFNYYSAFDPSTPEGLANRTAHLRDEAEFIARAQSSEESCNLKPVTFVKPLGTENEHPGYTSESIGSDHLVQLLQAVQGGACRKNTMVVVTYDEFGGQWDHVIPPGQGETPGPHDQWGPGTRIPAIVIAPYLQSDFVVDHTQYDTTSILATIEHRFGLAPLGTRDAAVNDLSPVFRAQGSG